MKSNLLNGKIYKNLVLFVLPILLALFLQAAYGAVDLLVVGQFGSRSDISGVSTGSQIMHSITMVITYFATGSTILIGNKIGEKKDDEANASIGTSIILFLIIGLVFTIILELTAIPFCKVMNTPDEAFNETLSYVRICSAGFIFITAYNLLGSICRGLGDSKTPLITVLISALINVGLDLLLCAVFNLGAKGAAYATIISQAISVFITFIILKFRKNRLFAFKITKKELKVNREFLNKIIKLGLPLAIQELLVGISFLVLMAIVNKIGLVESAAIGVSNKVISFILLVPSAFSQAVSAFVAQNMGAKMYYRAKKAMLYGIITSIGLSIIIFHIGFYHGDILCGIFSKDLEVNNEASLYIKAYAIDSFLTSLLFNLMGYLNGVGKTKIVMLQGILGAFLIRIPFAYIMSLQPDTNLFYIGLATPTSSTFQIIMCVITFIIVDKKYKDSKEYNLKEAIEK